MNKTKLGKGIRATSMDKEAAGLVGINTETAYMVAFGISAAIAGACGCAMTYYYYFQPSISRNFRDTWFHCSLPWWFRKHRRRICRRSDHGYCRSVCRYLSECII